MYGAIEKLRRCLNSIGQVILESLVSDTKKLWRTLGRRETLETFKSTPGEIYIGRGIKKLRREIEGVNVHEFDRLKPEVRGLAVAVMLLGIAVMVVLC